MPSRPERLLLPLLGAIVLCACQRAPDNELPGTLEWDRVNVLAEVSEPVIALEVKEGDQVQAGQVLLRLDPRRTDAQLAGARADVQRLSAQLDELRHGARVEIIDAARAQLQRAESDAANARRAHDRALELRKSGTIAQATLDDASNALRMAQASANATRAQLTELLHGTRPEQLEQAEAALAAAEASAQRLAVTRERLDVRAVRGGRVDALPFRFGDQPPVGATLVSLLAGDAPYARVYVPERLRASTRPGQHFRVHVDGVDKPFDAVLRSVRSEPAFTPYYALSGDDATRLSYRAELVLQGEAARELPAGLPCHAERSDHAGR
jgi:HlyD family secretion protein